MRRRDRLAPASIMTEREIKLKATDLRELVRRLRKLGFRRCGARALERNILFDNDRMELQKAGALLRLRSCRRNWVLTYKGPGQAARHKVREEIEVPISQPKTWMQLLSRLDFRPTFRYEKYRTEYTDGRGLLTVDETPIGDFLELEGAPGWIDRTAASLGYNEREYIRKSYGQLYREYCRREGLAVADMVFRASA